MHAEKRMSIDLEEIKVVRAIVNTEFKVALPSDQSKGGKWYYTLGTAPIEYKGVEYVPPKSGEGPGLYVFTFLATSAGQGNISMEHANQNYPAMQHRHERFKVVVMEPLPKRRK